MGSSVRCHVVTRHQERDTCSIGQPGCLCCGDVCHFRCASLALPPTRDAAYAHRSHAGIIRVDRAHCCGWQRWQWWRARAWIRGFRRYPPTATCGSAGGGPITCLCDHTRASPLSSGRHRTRWRSPGAIRVINSLFQRHGRRLDHTDW